MRVVKRDRKIPDALIPTFDLSFTQSPKTLLLAISRMRTH
jgi:hypothetical protein